MRTKESWAVCIDATLEAAVQQVSMFLLRNQLAARRFSPRTNALILDYQAPDPVVELMLANEIASIMQQHCQVAWTVEYWTQQHIPRRTPGQTWASSMGYVRYRFFR